MSTQTEATVLERVRAMHDYIREGRILDAVEEFYAEDCAMQEGLGEPIRGRDVNLEREKEFLDSIAEWKGFEVKAIAVDGDRSLAETTMDFVTKDGQEVHLEQIARAIWRDGRIVDERFYAAAPAPTAEA